MRKISLILMAFLCFVMTNAHAEGVPTWGGMIGPRPPVILATDCSGYIQESLLCYDTDDDKLYVGTGAVAIQVPTLTGGPLAFSYTDSTGLADGSRVFDFTTTGSHDPAGELASLYGAYNWTAGTNGTFTVQGVEGVVRSKANDEAGSFRGGLFRTYIDTDTAPTASMRTAVGLEASARAAYAGGVEATAESGTAFVGERIWMAPYFNTASVDNINNFWGLWIYGEHATQRNADAAIKISDAGGGFTDDIILQDGSNITDSATGPSIGKTTAGKNLSVVATLGAEKITWTAAGWDEGGVEWTVAGTPVVITHATGNVTALTSTLASDIVAGVTYKVVITYTQVAGTCSYTLGGVTGSSIATSVVSTSITDYITASTTVQMIITPLTTSNIVISSISIKALTDATGDLTVNGTLTANGQMLVALSGPSYPAIADIKSPTSGLYFAAGTLFYSSGGSASILFDGSGPRLRSDIYLRWSATTDPIGTPDLILSRDSAQTLQLGYDAATASAQTLKAADSTGAGIAGANLILSGGSPGAGGTAGSVKITPPGGTAFTIEAPGASGGIPQSDGANNWARVTSLTGLSIDLGTSVASGHAVTMDANGVLQTGFTALLPDTDNGATLGSGTYKWSDLYGADGFTLNIGNAEDLSFTATSDTITIGTNTGVSTVNWGSIAQVTTGTINGGIKPKYITTYNPAQLSGTDSYGTIIYMTTAGTIPLANYASGMNVCVYSTAAKVVRINPDDASKIVLNGTALTVGNDIYSAGAAGDYICLHANTTNTWTNLGRSGTWTDGS